MLTYQIANFSIKGVDSRSSKLIIVGFIQICKKIKINTGHQRVASHLGDDRYMVLNITAYQSYGAVNNCLAYFPFGLK